MKKITRLLLTVVGVGLSACSVQNEENISDFYPVSYQNLSGWDQEDYSQLLTVFRQTCHRIQELPSDTYLGGARGLFGGRTQDWKPACQAAYSVNAYQPLEIKQFFETWLQPYQYSINPQDGKITGYYEPEIKGSKVQTALYKVPVYGRPDNLISEKGTDGKVKYGMMQNDMFVPYYTRAQINQGVLQGKNLEVAWLQDPADLFFMQIQGSGRIILPNGQIMRLAYAGKNGQPYTPLGKILIDQGLMSPESVNMYSLRSWLHTHPTEAQSLMDENKNYVFFKNQQNYTVNQGPVGAFGTPLMAGRSVAVDKDWIPLGTPIWLETTMPVQPNPTRHDWKHMVFAHDLGGGIQGMNRLDLFTGWGDNAGWYAGVMNEKGKVFLLLPKRPQTQSLSTIPPQNNNP